MAFVGSCILPRTGLSHGTTALCMMPAKVQLVVRGPLDIQAAKHAQLKGAKKSNRRRPKKHRPSDINRKPPPYAVDPLRAEGLPEQYEIIPKSQLEELGEDVTADLTEPAVPESENKTEPIEKADSEDIVAAPESKTAVNEPEAVEAGAVAEREVAKTEDKQAEVDGAAVEAKGDVAEAEASERKEVVGAAGTEA